jgi:hypothetical protein
MLFEGGTFSQDIHPRILTALGRVAIEWENLQYMLRLLISFLAGIDPPISHIWLANMSAAQT